MVTSVSDPRNLIVIMTLVFSSFVLLERSIAQTTLSGDHVIAGDLSVGTTGTRGNIKINGETGNAAEPALRIAGDGGVVFTGSYGVGQMPAVGSGPSFMWYPKKAALRVGFGAILETAIGNGSAAFGYGTASGYGASAFGDGYASGESSVAFGGYASGYCSFSGGFVSDAVGDFSIAMGYFSVAYGIYSLSYGDFCEASGDYSIALGEHSHANGNASVALGSSSAWGNYAVAIGSAMALGERSTATGRGLADGDDSFASGWSFARGNYSSSFGMLVNAKSVCEFAVGRFNRAEGDSFSWVETDALFSVGNGTGNTNDPPGVRYRNAFTVKKNGDVEMTGRITAPRQGDILMGEFGNPE